MSTLFRDTALSFTPAWVRGRYRPYSSLNVLRGAILTGMAQTLFCAWGLLAGYRAFLLLRMEQYGLLFQNANETTQAWFGGIFLAEYVLFHPLALLLSYLALEGFVRFAGGVCVSEAVPSLPVVLAFAMKALLNKKQEQRALGALASIPDAVEALEDGDRFRIAAARAKPNWNASLTIEIRGQCYEVEREETGCPPRMHVYLLRRAPIGKILRGYERYDPTAPVNRKA